LKFMDNLCDFNKSCIAIFGLNHKLTELAKSGASQTNNDKTTNDSSWRLKDVHQIKDRFVRGGYVGRGLGGAR
jgi:hypothetical protein